MKLLIFSLFLTALCACSGQSPTDDFGSGTRGGGDPCEMDFRSQLQSAYYQLMAAPLQNKMSDSEKKKIKTLTLKKVLDIDVRCSSEPILVNGVEKAAFTQSLEGGKVSTVIDLNRWYGSPRNYMTGLAAHEILVMEGIESTGDYHLSMADYRFTQYPYEDKLECKKTVSAGKEIGLTVQLSKTNPGLKNYEAILVFTDVTLEGKKMEANRIKLSDGLDCRFSSDDGRLFSCFEAFSKSTDIDVAIEMISASQGFELRISWPLLVAPSTDLKEVNDIVHRSIRYLPRNPNGITIPFGGYSNLDPSNLLRCNLISQPWDIREAQIH